MASPSMRWVLFLLFYHAFASPTVSYPINAQVPPVARVSEQFSFVFSLSTFATKPEEKTVYTLANAPAWLSIDSDERRLFGTPSDHDITPGEVVGIPIEVVATDDSGSATDSAVLVVSRNKGPTIHVPFSDQVPGFGIFSRPSSVLSEPNTDFTLNFASDTFADATKNNLTYYAVTGENTPLPAWLTFDSKDLSFRGKTPSLESLVQPPQIFSFQLIASDVVGFSGCTVPFSIVVGDHHLTVRESVVVLHAAIGEKLSYGALQDMVEVDGKRVAPGDALSISSEDLPLWLSIDNLSWEISGTPPATAASTNCTISLGDQYGDTTNVTLSIILPADVFKLGLPDISVDSGSFFTLDLKPYFADPSDVDVIIESVPLAGWIHLDPTTLTISGDVPPTSAESDVDISIQAASKSTGRVGWGLLSLHVKPVVQMSTSHVSTLLLLTASSIPQSTSPRPAKVPSPTTKATDSSDAENSGFTRTSRALAIVIPTALVIVVFVAIVWCCLRRRRARDAHGKLEARDISAPLPGSCVCNRPEDRSNDLIGEPNKQHDFGGPPLNPQATDHMGTTAQEVLPRSGTFSNGVSYLPDCVPPVRTRRSLRSVSENALSETRESLAPLGSKGRPRKSRSKSYLSDTSFYGSSVDLASRSTSIRLLGHCRRENSWPDTFNIRIPAAHRQLSIQKTPDLMYDLETGRIGDRLQLPHKRASMFDVYPIGSLSSQALPSRPIYRMGNYTFDSNDALSSLPTSRLKSYARPVSRLDGYNGGSLDTKSSRTWAKAGAAVGFLRSIWRKGQPRVGPSKEDIEKASPDSTSARNETAEIHPPRAAHLVGRAAHNTPVGMKMTNTAPPWLGEALPTPRRKFIPRTDNEPSTAMAKTAPQGTTWKGEPASPQPNVITHACRDRNRDELSIWKGKPVEHLCQEENSYKSSATGQKKWTHEPRDSLGIAYRDLVGSSPFQSAVDLCIDTEAPERKAGTLKPAANWNILEESPVIRDWSTISTEPPDVPAKSPKRNSRSPLAEFMSPQPSISPSTPDNRWIGKAVSRYSEDDKDAERTYIGTVEGSRRKTGTNCAAAGEEDYAVYI